MIDLDAVKGIRPPKVGEIDAPAKLRAELAQRLNEISELKARLYAMECENSDMKIKMKDMEADLRETQTTLGQFVVAANRKAQTNAVAKPPAQSKPFLKRARSPSLEIIEIVRPFQPKTRKEKKVEVLNEPLVSIKKDDSTSSQGAVPSDSAPPKEKTSQPSTNASTDSTDSLTPSNSLNETTLSPECKRRKVELDADGAVITLDQKPFECKEENVILLDEILSNGDSTNAPSTQNLSPVLAEPDHQSASTSTPTSEIPTQKETSDINPASNTEPTSIVPLIPTPTSKRLHIKSSPTETKKRSNIKNENAFTLPDSEVKLYLQSCKPLLISPPPLDLEVPRALLRIAYGGCDMRFLQFPQRNPSGARKRRMVFPMVDLNPCIPRNPGEPGLIFASRHEILSNPPWTLFIKRRNVAPAVWSYLGEYECLLCGTMTAEQFQSQSPVVQMTWAKFLLGMMEFDVYVSMRARIALRKAGKIPVDDKETQERLVTQEMNAVKKKNVTLPVTAEDIIDAFCNGDEGIDIIRMKCVEYDHVFANDMKIQFSNYPTLLAADRRKQAKLKAGKPSFRRKKGSRSVTTTKGRKSAEAKRTRITLSATEEFIAETSSPSSSSAETGVGGSTSETTVPEGLRRSSRQRSSRLVFSDILSESDSCDDDDSQSLYDETSD